MNTQPATSTKQRMFHHDQAEEAASRIIETLSGCAVRIEVAGSIRRNMQLVHDIDIVLQPKVELVQEPNLFDDGPSTYRPVMLLMLLDTLGWSHTKTPYPRFLTLLSEELEAETHGIPVELFLTEPDGSNYEAMMQMRTGCEAFNISIASLAKRMGMEYRAGHGIYREGERMDDGTEQGIFEALKLPWFAPERRTDDYRFLRGNVR